MKLRYAAEARGHIAAIFNFINERNPVAATQVVTRIRLAAERLAEFPRIGHTRPRVRHRTNGGAWPAVYHRV